MSSDGRNARKARKAPRKTSEFWRACGFLYPHRGIVVVSICCAVFVGAAFTGGMTTMLPILKILIDHDTVPNWVNRKIVEQRLHAKFTDEVKVLRLAEVRPGHEAYEAGLRGGEIIRRDENPVAKDLADWSDPQQGLAEFAASGTAYRVPLDSVPRHLALARVLSSHVPADPVLAIMTIFAFIVVMATLGNVARFFQEYLSDKAAILCVNDIRRKLYDHVLHLPVGFFSLKGSSDLTSRLVQDAQGLETGFKTVLGQSIQEPIKAAMYFGLALWSDWRLTLFIVLFAPVMVAMIRKFGKKMRRASRKALQNSSTMLGQIDATLAGIRVVKSASAERFERRRYRGIMSGLIGEQVKMSRIDAFSAPTIEMMALVVIGVVLFFASAMIFWWNTLEATKFFMVMAALAAIGDSLRRLGKVNNVLSKASAASARIFEILEVPVERPGGHKAKENSAAPSPPRPLASSSGLEPRNLPPIRREIRFEAVTFAYPGSVTPAVESVNLTVPKGQSVAVVGRNGSGKTTLLALLPRFYDPQEGRVLIDGIDVKGVALRSLRRQIAIVTQDSVIFPGTIASNIAYGMPNPDREKVIDAARRAFAHEFITEKPGQYEAILGEQGSGLSGGQKQRLCIARAIYRAAPILILDEATSQVDAESEHLIQQAIESLMHERTTFVIAHRFSTILSADRIIVMDRGRIVGQGKHEDLLTTCETYANLYERQLVTVSA